jgi:cytoplasmic iron level regulating protein YaaA (DUF328/UPF0246 family)
MFIFIPPSETKAFPSDAAPADLGSLALPELAQTREALRDALVRLCRGPEAKARETLGLSEGLSGESVHNRDIMNAPAGPAADVYTGVLYDALDLPTLRHRGVILDHVLIFSGLWGVVRPGDHIPHYRCSAGVKLPGVGSGHVAEDLVVDLRSGAYAGLWTPGANAVTVRVLHEREVGGVVKRTVVSHFNKATKGRIARALLESGHRPRKPEEFVEVVRGFGYTVEAGPESARPDAPTAIDVVVSEL